MLRGALALSLACVAACSPADEAPQLAPRDSGAVERIEATPVVDGAPPSDALAQDVTPPTPDDGSSGSGEPEVGQPSADASTQVRGAEDGPVGDATHDAVRDATAPSSLGTGNPNSTGLDRHDALYCGEWQLTSKPGDTIYLVRGGKVVWSYSLSSPASDEFSDCAMMSNGHVVFSLKDTGAQEIVPDLQRGQGGAIVWRYNQDPKGEVHSVQPIGLDKVLVMQNGNNANRPKLLLIDKTKAAVCTSGAPCVDSTWFPDFGTGTHLLARHVRMLANGNLLLPYLGGKNPLEGHVVEYTRDWQIVWDYDSKADPWAAVRLANGHTLVSTSASFREVTHDSPPKLVWQMTRADFPPPGLHIGQGMMRLANGNTLLANWNGNVANTATWPTFAQYWEVTPDKKIVWTVQSWLAPNLGPGSSIQALDQPGLPENPADFQR